MSHTASPGPGALPGAGRDALFEAAFRQSSLPTAIASFPDGRLIDINQAACETLGVTREAALGKTPTEAGLQIFDADAQSVLQALLTKGYVVEHPLRWVHEGREHWESMSASLIEVGGERQMIVTITDITERHATDEALRASEALFSAAFTGAAAMMLITSLRNHGVVVDANDAFLRQTGLIRDQVVGARADTLALFANPADLDRIVAQLMTTGRVRNLELPVRTRHGDHTVCLFSADVIQLKGEPHAIFTIVDLSERVAAEDRLRASEQRYRNLVEQTADGVLMLDESGIVLDVNPAMCEFLGYPRDQLIGRNWIAFVEPKSLAAMPFLRPEIEPGKPAVFERTIVRADGSIAELEIHARRYPNGQMLGVARDIGPRKAAERERARLIEAVEQSADAIAILDPDGTVAYINPVWARSVGWDRATSVGRNYREMDSGVRASAVYEEIVATAHRDGIWAGELTGKGPDGKMTYVWMTVSSLTDSAGEPASIVVVRRDVTREHELEELLRQAQKMEAVGRLAGGVAHDFNNLLTAISGFTELALAHADECRDAEMADYLEQIKMSSQRAASLTRQLLTFGRRARTQDEVLDLNQICQDIVPMLRRIIGEDVALELSLDPGLRPIFADRGHLEQVIVNLAVNARDAMPNGGRIDIATSNVLVEPSQARLEAGDVHRDDVRLLISDSGVGIDPDILDKIWEPFFTTKPAGSGVGLGLATVFGIVRGAGGHIHVESAPGRGSKFMVDLPAVEALPVAAVAVASVAESPRGRETILVVEDEPAVIAFATRLLERTGYRVLRAANGADALEIARAHDGPIDLVFSDVVMPGMSGYEVAAAIRELRPNARILLSSGYNEETNVRSGGHVDIPFIAKPYLADDLLKTIRETLSAS